MDNPSSVFGDTPATAGPPRSGSRLPDDWRLARAAHVDLMLMGMPRVNLLLVAPDGVVRFVLESLLLDLHEPIARWRPGEDLVLPPAETSGTLVIHDADALTLRDQIRLLEWLEQAEGRTQVVSTSRAQLLPRVRAGGFVDMLYYRLNTVCVNVTS